MHLNIRCLPVKFDNLKVLLSELEGTNLKHELLVICETWLTDLNANLFSIPGFELIEKHMNNGRGGGVCIYNWSGIRYSVQET